MKMHATSVRKLTVLTCGALMQVLSSASSSAAISAIPPLSISSFASAPAGATSADSVAVDGNNVFVGFGNGGAPDGSGGASSTIAQYTSAGALVQTFTVPGHDDGLRVDPSTHLLWAVQNEDANAQLQVINTTTGIKTAYSFSSAAHGGGYDDLVFRNGVAYFTASNPSTDINNLVNGGPAVISGTLSATQVLVTGVLANNAAATNLLTAKPVTLNLTDPDSMTVSPSGDLVFVSQADNELIFLHNPGTPQQTAGLLPLTDPTGAPASVDDTLFVPATGGEALVTDSGTNAIYLLNVPASSAGTVISADTDTSLLAEVNVATGVLTPIVTGLSAPKGLTLLSTTSAVPLPCSFYMAISVMGLIVGIAAYRRKMGLSA